METLKCTLAWLGLCGARVSQRQDPAVFSAFLNIHPHQEGESPPNTGLSLLGGTWGSPLEILGGNGTF